MEADGARLDEQRFPGRQGRIVFAYLAVQNGRAVPRDELAEALWGEDLPATWEKALRVLMTKLRALLEGCGIDGSTALTSAFGCYTLTLPADAWIDVHAAVSAVEQAEAALAAGELDDACEQARTAAGLARGTFLPGEDGPWVEEQRRDLRDLLVRALECARDASFAAGTFGDALRYATEITELEPFRESSYRALMQAHTAAGNRAEALRVYERCRRFLADELGAYPSPETEAVYREILQSPPNRSEGVDRPGEESRRDELPAPMSGAPPRRGRRRLAVIGVLLAASVATAAGLAFTSHHKPPVRLLPNSLVRLDPKTLKPTKVVPIGPKADLVVVSGGYVWLTHRILRYTNDEGLRNAGDRNLTRYDPSTGESETVGGGLAPCGITPDPSGDVWVANCYASGGGGNVVRVHAKTTKFGKSFAVPTGDGFYRGMVYGGGSLWLAGMAGGPTDRRLIQLDPRTQNGNRRTFHLERAATALAWSAGYGDLWMTNFGDGSVSRRRTETGDLSTTPLTIDSPAPLAVQGNGVAVWVGDWNTRNVVRISADRSRPPRVVSLPVKATPAGVTQIAAGNGAIWATAPDAHAVIRIDPSPPYRTRKIRLHYAPWGVAVDPDDGAIWVALRWRKTYVPTG